MPSRRRFGGLGLAVLASPPLWGWSPVLASTPGAAQGTAPGALLAAAPASAPGARQGLPADLPQWLHRLQAAASGRSYQGTVAYSVAGSVSSARLQHHGGGRERVERLEVLDGKARLQYRHNDQTLTVWPSHKLAVVEPADPVPAFPFFGDLQGLRPQDHYELRRGGSERVAGRDAEVLQVNPRDGQRHAQRWWSDRETGLLLRCDTLGPQGQILESAAFTDLLLLPRPQPEPVLAAMRRLDGLRVVKAQATRADLEAEGWQWGRTVTGFQLRQCHRRPLDAAGDGPATPVLQSVFSDGLAHVSLFVETFDPARHRQGMRTAMGATSTLMHRRGDWWITVVGEVPMATAQQFDAALERRR